MKTKRGRDPSLFFSMISFASKSKDFQGKCLKGSSQVVLHAEYFQSLVAHLGVKVQAIETALILVNIL